MTKSIAKKSTTGSVPPAVPLAITPPTFSPWTHTSDDSYIYQLSLVVATATVSFFIFFTFGERHHTRTTHAPHTRSSWRNRPVVARLLSLRHSQVGNLKRFHRVIFIRVSYLISRLLFQNHLCTQCILFTTRNILYKCSYILADFLPALRHLTPTSYCMCRCTRR